MKAPDKIYVNIPGDYWHAVGSDKTVNDVEYIRKDRIREMVVYTRNMSQTPDAAIRNWDLLIQSIDDL